MFAGEASEASTGLFRLLRPRAIAVFGGKGAAEVVRQLRRIGYAGAVWPVHPSREEVAGVPAFRSVAALPAAPDAAFLGVNRRATIEVMADLAARGVGGAVVHAAGFAEIGGEGRDLQRRLDAVAGATPYLGPNCYGFINYFDGALLWPDQHGGQRVSRGVAIVTQSGNIGLNLTMQRRALPLGYVLTLGNQARVDLGAAVAALAADERVTAIGLHIEGIGDPGALARAVAGARARGVAVVALRAGRTADGAQLTVSHTASLAGGDAVVSAFLRRIGVAEVDSIPALLETLKLLHFGGPLAGRDIASLSCSGGEAALIADKAVGRRLAFRAFTPDEAARVAATLSPLVTISNPLDYHTFSWANGPALTETFAAVMAAGFAMTLLILDLPRRERCRDADWLVSAEALAAAARRAGARAAIVATLPETMPEERAQEFAEMGLTPLLGVDEALAALEAAADAGAPADEAPLRLARGPAAGNVRTLSEWEAKRLLAERGLATPEGRLAQKPADAAAAAEALGCPVAVKAVGSAIAHKSEIGAVRLGLGDAAAVIAAAEALQGLGEALLVERMVGQSVAELIVGVARDPVFGLYLLVGSGGVLAELVADTRVLLLPASASAIERAIGSLKLGRIIAGFRNRPRGDLAAAVDAVLAVQSFAMAHADRLIELDINPLIIRAAGGGAVAADALIRLIEEKDDG